MSKTGGNDWKQSIEKWGRNSIKQLKNDVEGHYRTLVPVTITSFHVIFELFHGISSPFVDGLFPIISPPFLTCRNFQQTRKWRLVSIILAFDIDQRLKYMRKVRLIIFIIRQVPYQHVHFFYDYLSSPQNGHTIISTRFRKF